MDGWILSGWYRRSIKLEIRQAVQSNLLYETDDKEYLVKNGN